MISEKLMNNGIKLFMNKRNFNEWLNTDVKVLGNKKPKDWIKENGEKKIFNLISQMKRK